MDKLVLVFAAVLTVASFKAAAGGTIQAKRFTVETKNMTQKLDHFNYSDTRTTERLYAVVKDYYAPGGPLFVFVDNNYPYGANISFYKSHTFMFQELAKEHNGLFVHHHRRHRAYSIKDVKYMTVEQQLADLSYFIRFIKKTYAGMENAKVILFGVHFSGSLAVWFKKLYPDLVNGVWASGAPLLAKADFSEYCEILGQSIKKVGGDACYNRIQNGVAELDLMLANNRTAEVKQMLKLCPSFDGSNHLDISVVFYKIFEAFNFIINRHHLTIAELCDGVMRQPNDIKAIFEVLVWREPKCVESSYRSYIEQYKHKNVLPAMSRKCNQYGWFPTSGSPNQPFGRKYPLSFFATICKDLFGNNFTTNDLENNVREFNDNYGGIDLQLENVHFTYGEFDPHRFLGTRDGKKTTIMPSCVTGCDFWVDNGAPELNPYYKTLAAQVTKWLR